VQADAAVCPDDQQQQCLAHPEVRVQLPEVQQDRRVGIREVEPFESEPRADGVHGEQWQDGKPEHELHSFQGRHAQVPAKIERPERQAVMQQQRPVQHDGAKRISPQPQEPFAAVIHRRQRHQPQCVIGKMGRDVGKQYQARN
jgi:hypothetical protein